MKVGTDGVLLGAWASVGASTLDVGTGTGLIALMAAQRRSDARITAIDIDPDAVRQAQENVCTSPFATRITVCQADIRSGLAGQAFNSIICNPPYFENALRSPDAARATARHDDKLTFDDLAYNSAALLRDGGTLSVVIPLERRADMTSSCATFGLTLVRETHVRTLPAKPPKRTLMEFFKGYTNPCLPDETDSLIIESAPSQPTSEFKMLLKDFYLKF